MESLPQQLNDALPKVENKGSGAGGKNTNLFGKKFEDLTNNHIRLLVKGFEQIKIGKGKYDYYLKKDNIVFTIQGGFKTYMKYKYNIDFMRCPDEAYIIEKVDGKVFLVILEKKEQNVEGSVETKLYAGPLLRDEYQIIAGDNFEVHYIFCLSKYFKNKFLSGNKKYSILNQLMTKYNIHCLFGEDEDYFDSLDIFLQI
jgi:hypothetical protein